MQLHAQYDSTLSLPEGWLSSVSAKLTSLEGKLRKQQERVLSRMQRQEEKLFRQLARKDSTQAAKLLAESRQQYSELKARLERPLNGKPAPYLPYLDTLKTSLRFLKDLPDMQAKLPDIAAAELSVQQWEKQWAKAEQLKAFIRQRKQQLKDRLDQLSVLKGWKQLNKTAYYYAAQLQEYKALLKDRKQLEQKALLTLQRLPVFQQFLREHSQLAALFRLPGSGGGSVDALATSALAGLQTRASVQQEILQRFGAQGMQAVQENVRQAQGAIATLKAKAHELLGAGGDEALEMPDFKPNTQKTKSFLDRLEYGANLQSQPSTSFLPASSDLGASLGYKLNDKSVVGIGMSYRWGWGHPLKEIRLTSEGIGLRSFLDARLKGSLWITGGYELNYHHRFRGLTELKSVQVWQRSALIGLTKKYALGKKKGNMQLLWDLLSKQQTPQGQAIKFRVGYVF